jgi:hypothetical protein
MKRLGCAGWSLVIGLAVLFVVIGAPTWHWAVRGQLDVIEGRVKLNPNADESVTPQQRLLSWDGKTRNFGKGPLFANPKSAEEQVANALWISDEVACRKALKAIAEANPKSAVAQAMVVTDAGPIHKEQGPTESSKTIGERRQPESARIAAGRRGAALEPQNAFWALAQISRRSAATKDELCQALVPAGKAKQFADPRETFTRWLCRAVEEQLGRGKRAALAAGAIPKWPAMTGSSALKELGDDPESLKARLGLLNTAHLLSRVGKKNEIMVAKLLAAAAVRHELDGGAVAFNAQLQNARIDLGGIDPMAANGEIGGLVGRFRTAAANLSTPPADTDYDLLGAMALLAALLAIPCAGLAVLIQKAKSRGDSSRSPSVLIGVLLTGLVSAFAGVWLATWMVGFVINPLWFIAALAVFALLPRGPLKATQIAGPLVLLFAVVHAAFTVATVRQDAEYGQVIERQLENSGDLIRSAR